MKHMAQESMLRNTRNLGVNTLSNICRDPGYPAYQKDQMCSEIWAKNKTRNK